MLRPGTMIDRYRVEMLIGSGGMAFVYLATDLVTSSPVALKVLRRDSLEHQVRLRAGGELQGRLRHPNLVRVVAPLSDAPVLVLEYVEGPSLAAALDEFGPFTIDQVDRIARDVLRGLAHAHDHGLVHRDLTLGNVLLDLGGASVVARVTDFGLAKELDGDGTGTRSQVALGTPAYMAPSRSATLARRTRARTCTRRGRCSTRCSRGGSRFPSATSSSGTRRAGDGPTSRSSTSGPTRPGAWSRRWSRRSPSSGSDDRPTAGPSSPCGRTARPSSRGSAPSPRTRSRRCAGAPSCAATRTSRTPSSSWAIPPRGPRDRRWDPSPSCGGSVRGGRWRCSPGWSR